MGSCRWRFCVPARVRRRFAHRSCLRICLPDLACRYDTISSPLRVSGSRSGSGVWGGAPTLKNFVPLCALFVAKALCFRRREGTRRTQRDLGLPSAVCGEVENGTKRNCNSKRGFIPWDEGSREISYLSINVKGFSFARLNHSQNFRLPLQPTEWFGAAARIAGAAGIVV